MRIVFVGEWLQGIADEGIRNFARNISLSLAINHQVVELGLGKSFIKDRLLLNPALAASLSKAHPDLLFYISPSCAEITAFFRAKILKFMASSARVFLVALQPVNYSGFELKLLPILAPDGVFVQSPESIASLHFLRCPVHFIPGGVNTTRFKPVDQAKKESLREKYGISRESFVMLHVGHINRNRNVQLMKEFAGRENMEIVLVGSTSTEADRGLIGELRSMGIKVLQEYMPAIEEIYQLADVYFFPVQSSSASISVPLSVLEAMACNLPIITTPFGGLPLMFQEMNGFFYFTNKEDLPTMLEKVKELKSCKTCQMVASYSWGQVAQRMLDLAVYKRELS